MQQPKARIDIVNEILEACILAYPLSPFIISLYKQYLQRGSLSKKQLQGLYAKASDIQALAPGKLAGLEAILKKMPTRYKSEKPAPSPLYQKDQSIATVIDQVLSKLPGHKRALFLKAKYENNEPLSAADIADLRKIEQLVREKNQD